MSREMIERSREMRDWKRIEREIDRIVVDGERGIDGEGEIRGRETVERDAGVGVGPTVGSTSFFCLNKILTY